MSLVLEDHVLAAIAEAGYCVVPLDDLKAAHRQLVSPFPKEELVVAKLNNLPTPAQRLARHINGIQKAVAGSGK